MKKLFVLVTVGIIMACSTPPQENTQHLSNRWIVVMSNGDSIKVEAEDFFISPDNLNAYFINSKKERVACFKEYKYIFKLQKGE